ncbi:hypothetical protein [Saccharopolyspora sp. 5N708]|uniref:hypothetical protein n=1 Tax=Saccharopolyspora sp. 5N708 TaxID=3457424 RepID=UPI003FD294F4
MILGSVLNPVNSSMIAVSLIPIGAAFGAPPSQTAWLISALYLATLAPTLGALIFARVLLGLGTCAGYPAAMFLIRSESQRTGRDSPNTVLTALSVASQTISVIGPTLGGLLIGLGGWRTPSPSTSRYHWPASSSAPTPPACTTWPRS